MRNCIMIGKGGSGMRRSDLGAYLLGVALIGIGLVLLLNNARIISVDLRNLISDYLLLNRLGGSGGGSGQTNPSEKRLKSGDYRPDEAESSSEAQHSLIKQRRWTRVLSPVKIPAIQVILAVSLTKFQTERGSWSMMIRRRRGPDVSTGWVIAI